MLEYGHIKLHRRIVKWRWYQDANTTRLFIHLLLTVNYEPCDFQNMTIERGQRIASYKGLSQELGLSVQQIRTALNHLKSTNEIAYYATSKYTVITVLNYDMYQEQQQAKQQSSNNQSTKKQQTSNNNVRNNNKAIKQRSKEVKYTPQAAPLPYYDVDTDDGTWQ